MSENGLICLVALVGILICPVQLLVLFLKVTGKIAWSFGWVFSPIWIPSAVISLSIIFVVIRQCFKHKDN